MLSSREQLERQLASMKKARSPFESAWRDIMRQVAPYRVEFDMVSGGRYGGHRRDYHILNNHPIRALRTLSAGLMASVTSPAKKWHRLTVSDPELAKWKPVKMYLSECQDIIDASFAGSNLYNELSAGLYPDLSAVGVSPIFEEESYPGKPWFQSIPVGSYWLGVNSKRQPDTLFREMEMTVKQMHGMFQRDRISLGARNDYERGNNEAVRTIRHAVTPNDDMGGIYNKPWKSCWWEKGAGDHLLLEGGFWEFPVMAPRWETMGSLAYGFGPGWYALGDCRMLQHHEEKLMVLLDKMANPPMVASDGVDRASLVPGSVTYVPEGTNPMYRPAHEVNPASLNYIEQHIERAQRRISETFYVHLWQLLVQDTRNQPATATEVEYKRQEAMLMLGPLLENLNNGLLEPLVMRTFHILDRADKLPLPPPELEGAEVRVEFTSIMHTMQQATGLAPIRTLIDEVLKISQIRPDVVDKLDSDAIVEDLQKITGARPDSILDKEEVDKIRAARAEQQRVQQEGMAMTEAAGAINKLGNTDPDALAQIGKGFAPAVAAQGSALG